MQRSGLIRNKNAVYAAAVYLPNTRIASHLPPQQSCYTRIIGTCYTAMSFSCSMHVLLAFLSFVMFVVAPLLYVPILLAPHLHPLRFPSCDCSGWKV